MSYLQCMAGRVKLEPRMPRRVKLPRRGRVTLDVGARERLPANATSEVKVHITRAGYLLSVASSRLSADMYRYTELIACSFQSYGFIVLRNPGEPAFQRLTIQNVSYYADVVRPQPRLILMYFI